MQLHSADCLGEFNICMKSSRSDAIAVLSESGTSLNLFANVRFQNFFKGSEFSSSVPLFELIGPSLFNSAAADSSCSSLRFHRLGCSLNRGAMALKEWHQALPYFWRVGASCSRRRLYVPLMSVSKSFLSAPGWCLQLSSADPWFAFEPFCACFERESGTHAAAVMARMVNFR